MHTSSPGANRASGSWRNRTVPLIDITRFILLLLLLGWLFSRSFQSVGYHWQWHRVWPLLVSPGATFVPGPLLYGLGVTLHISAISMILAFVIGMIVALFRLLGTPVTRFIARAYLEIIRNTPLLIQIFFIYFVIGPAFGLGRFAAAVLALSLFEGAYVSEILRSGILSVDRGQVEAAASIGLRTRHVYRFIILPQAIRTVLPPLTNQAISLIKDSALVSTIAIYDLTMQAQALISETFLTFEIWFTVAILYLVITVTLSLLVALLEKRLKSS